MKEKLKKTNVNLAWLLLAIIPLLLAFRVVFANASMSVGDAPFFNLSGSSQFLSEPQIWTQRGNALGGINQFIYIWPLMFMISFVQKLTLAESSLLIRLFFYVPSILFSATGGYILCRRYNFERKISLIASLITVLNTYYLLIFDGGQVGILLAYGLFPWTLIALLNFFREKASYLQFGISVSLLSILTTSDPRVALICLGTSYLFNLKQIKKLIIVSIAWFLTNLYWLYPLITVTHDNLSVGDGLELTSFLNGLFLYSPHWYQNIYGNVTYPSILFIVFPILIFGNLFFSLKDKKRLLLLTLFFVFLIKGTTPPFEFIFKGITSLPFGSAFRDSTKFFIPLIYISVILIANSIKSLSSKLGNSIIIGLYALIILSVYPAFLGKLNFVLSGNESNLNVPLLNGVLESDNSSYRSIWFPERDPRSYDIQQKSAVDAKSLTDFRVFARLNVGNSDLFNFLNSPESDNWLDLFGVKYLVLSGDPRLKELSKESKKDWERLNTLVNTSSALTKVRSTDVYKNEGTVDPIYGVKKLVVVVGSDNIYEKLEKIDHNFKPTNLGFAFVDDGKWNPSFMDGVASSAAVIVNNNNDPLDLQMSLMQKSFLGWRDSSVKQFATYTPEEYLKYKYELLIRKFDFVDFDYNKGIAFSTKKGERMSFIFDAPESGEYYVSIRFIAKDGIGILVDEKESIFINDANSLMWKTLKLNLSKGKHVITLLNKSELAIFNAISIRSEQEWNKTKSFAEGIFSKFKSFTPESFPSELLKDNRLEVDYEKESEGRYKLTPSTETAFIVFAETFNNNWKITRDTLSYDSLPFYSSINGIYKRPGWDNMTLEFVGQKQIRFGIYFSALSVLGLLILIIWKHSKKF